jgi:hypothetical protein
VLFVRPFEERERATDADVQRWREDNKKMIPETTITADQLWETLKLYNSQRDGRTTDEQRLLFPFARDKPAMEKLTWVVEHTSSWERQLFTRVVFRKEAVTARQGQ